MCCFALFSKKRKKNFKEKKMSMHSTDMNHDNAIPLIAIPYGLRHFVYWTAIFVVAQAMYLAFLTSWQQGGYSTLDTAWANAMVLFGFVLLWFFLMWITRGKRARHSNREMMRRENEE